MSKKKISELTEEQLQKVNEYRERFFTFATSTEAGDKELASQAAVRVAELAGLKNCEVKFASNPKEGGSLSDSLRESLDDSLSDSLRDSLSDSLSDSLRNSLSDSLSDSLRNSLWYSLSGSTRNSPWYSLRGSTWDSCHDSGWTAFYSFVVEELGVECTGRDREKLSLYRVIAENCSAVWIVPGTIIICDKPVRAVVRDGNLVEVEWGDKQDRDIACEQSRGDAPIAAPEWSSPGQWVKRVTVAGRDLTKGKKYQVIENGNHPEDGYPLIMILDDEGIIGWFDSDRFSPCAQPEDRLDVSYVCTDGDPCELPTEVTYCCTKCEAKDEEVDQLTEQCDELKRGIDICNKNMEMDCERANLAEARLAYVLGPGFLRTIASMECHPGTCVFDPIRELVFGFDPRKGAADD